MIIAMDFDGILCDNRFPEIGDPHYDVISVTRQLLDLGAEVVLWTSRTDKELEKAVIWCADYGLRFSAVNENAPSNIEQYKDRYPNGTRKVYADYYVDDHNVEFRAKQREGYQQSLHYVVSCLNELVYTLKQRRNRKCQED